ncbi:MAG TPA: hypothetical protein VFA59_18475 [Vicinamibacterales bacterium]|nr:hypothetical protein [Vicinamibacterales bacterium]
MLSLAVVLSSLSSGVQTIDPLAAFDGMWSNVDATNGITAAVITHSDAGWTIRAWGKCEPLDCPWKPILLAAVTDAFGAAISSRSSGSTEDRIATRNLSLIVDGDTLSIEVNTTWHDNSGRTVTSSRDTLKRSDVVDRVDDQKLSPTERALKRAYQSAFGAVIPHPAVFDDTRAVDCAGAGHAMTTAYSGRTDRRGNLLMLYASHDGTSITRSARMSNVLLPAGHFRVLAVLVDHPQTVTADGLRLWEAAQAKINTDHFDFAVTHGYASPIVTFDSTNVILSPREIGDGHNKQAISRALDRKSIRVDDFDILVTINLNPAAGEGGTSNIIDRFIYVGNFMHAKGPLSERDWDGVARTAYHQLMAYQWGWQRDWTPTCGGVGRELFGPFITAPALFGWEDLDGNGIPDILDRD